MCKELVYPIGRNRGESVAHVKDVISKGGKLLKKGSLAVFDNDENYTESFLEYIEEKKGMPFEIQVFTKQESLLQYLESREPQLLLVASDVMCHEIEKVNKEKIVILAGEEVSSSFSEYRTIYKYQSMENVIRQVIDYYIDITKDSIFVPVTKNKSEIIGIYSPVGNVGKTAVAWAMAQTLGADYTVLYINMQEYSGMDRMFDTDFGANLSDLMYFYKQSPESMAVKLKAVTYSAEGFDYIPPLVYSYDLRNIDTGQWLQFIQNIAELTEYDKIIIEFGQVLNNPMILLESCNRIFVPVSNDWMNQCKKKEWEEYLLRTGYEEILDRTEMLQVPQIRQWSSLDEYKECYLWGEPGDYIRQVLGGL